MKMKVHIIAPYESMIPIVKECIPLSPDLDITYSVGDLKQGVEIAILEEKKGTDVIISRGGTAQLIKKSVTIPVIDMHLSGYDMIRSLMLASNLKDKTAIVGFSNITSGAQSIIDILDFPLNVYTVKDQEEVAPLILKLKNLGYKQIVGDVITINTSFAYGLNGFLIQSGKESIMKSIEDAKLIYGYVQHTHHMVGLFEQLILKDCKNIIIINEKNEMIYEHLVDFGSNPLSKNQLYMLNTDLAVNHHTIRKSFEFNDFIIDVTGHHHLVKGERYHIYELEKNEIRLLEQEGIKAQTDFIREPIAAASSSMQTILTYLKSLYINNEVIVLQGNKGTGKDFITNYIHQELAAEGILLSIDFLKFNYTDLDRLSLHHVRTVKLKHIDSIQDSEGLTQFMKSCLEKNIRFIIISENGLKEIIRGFKINRIIMPNLTERKEDIFPLAQYFLSYYHQNYGTTAVKMKSDALELLENHKYPNNISDLKYLIKQIALNETNYVIQTETIQKVLSEQKPFLNILSPKGTLKEIEKEIIKIVLEEENNNQTRTAERLGINRATLWRKLKD
ncbi:sigma-54-dependent transcriptional regulator [bacterium LRH843]|nr:sigma-54-dependent transcriptional regulator [bacterium LRH843]